MHFPLRTVVALLVVLVLPRAGAAAQDRGGVDRADEASPTNSLVSRVIRARLRSRAVGEGEAYHALRAASMFAVPPPEPRRFELHDLVQVIVLESTTARSEQSLEVEKEYELNGRVVWPDLRLDDLLQLQISPQSSITPRRLDVEFDKDFEGEGEYERRDNFTTRLTAEVIEILPNGNLVVEARRSIQTDQEESVLRLTGVCRPEDVTAANTILSNQLHDLTVEMVNEGELRRASEKGILAQVLDAIFAF